MKTHQKPNLDEAEISVKDFENSLKDTNGESKKGQKVLGMWWNVKEDFFHFKICLNLADWVTRGRHVEELSEKGT